jgi:uncharacterized membrane protein YgdD (TMEM256/DUF423 family)
MEIKSTKIYTFEENTKMNKKLTIIALFLIALSIAFGAFGAHALKKLVILKWQLAFDTAVRYQFYGALLLLILSFQSSFSNPIYSKWITLFLVGLGLFTCSIYGLVLAELVQSKWTFLGPITPIGGLLMIISVVILAIKYATNVKEK